ncbi:DUF4913 domain-containing protein [Micromonospora sp. KC723]|uniref:DUF4913 domain-containing protein n=1 Tax=Micromonospora sp. KC723 TaxID=2530381 RepID=UPI001FB7AD0E|nr:DUF4913 domain-containing protein [Micromonospora sp. KC723]
MSIWWRDHLDPHLAALAASTGPSAGAAQTSRQNPNPCLSSRHRQKSSPSSPTSTRSDSVSSRVQVGATHLIAVHETPVIPATPG